MFSDIQPRISSSTPPPQFKRRHSMSPDVITNIEPSKDEQKEEFIGNSDSSVCSSNSSTSSSSSDVDSVIMDDEPKLRPKRLTINSSPELQKYDHEQQIIGENFQSSAVPNITTTNATITTTTSTSTTARTFEKKNADDKVI